MKYFLLRRPARIALAGLFAVMLLAGAAIANAFEPKLDDDLHFTLIPYLWLPSVDGSLNVNIPNGSGSSDLNPDNYLDNLKFALMLTLEVEKGKWGVFSDFMYIEFKDDDRTANFSGPFAKGLSVNGTTELKALVFEIAPTYSVYRTVSTRVDLLAGIRYAGIDTKLTLDASTPLPIEIPSRNFSDKVDLVDPIVGFKGRFELGKGWFIPYYFDIGGFGINDEFTWQAFGGLGYHFSKLFSMVLAYRHLEYDFHNDKLLHDLKLSGGQLGFVFRF